MPRHRHDPSKNLVGFLVGGITCAVRIEVVREIVNPLEVAELPLAPKSVRGVASFRGDVVPVVDLRDRFGLPPTKETRKSKWIIVDVASKSFAALAVDSVTEVFGTGDTGVRPSPALGPDDVVRGIEGVTEHGDRLVFVLDVRALRAMTEAVMAVS